jgi:transposase
MEIQTYCGLDLHKKFSAVCLMDASGQVIEQRKVYHRGGELEAFFEDQPHLLKVALEPVDNWGWVVDALQSLGHEVHLANTYKVRLIAESRIKTDKVDARVLADLLRTGYLPEAYVANSCIRDQRTYLRYRIDLARQRARLKTQVKRLFRVENHEVPEYSNLFGKKGRVWLTATALRPIHERIKEESLETIQHYDAYIAKLDAEIRQRCVKDETIQRLMTIPGIGQLSAQVIMAETGEMKRFRTAKHFASYCGLAVSQRSSAGKTRFGGITKQGNKNIRWILVEGAQKAKSSDPNLKRFFDRIAFKKGKAKATVAVARKLAEICWHVATKKLAYDTNKVCRRLG